MRMGDAAAQIPGLATVIEKIISGGQTGVDRAALDFAIDKGIPHGGWVPKGRAAEDGQVPARYNMQEHIASGYPPRTEANVRDSDATVVFLDGLLNNEPGCLLTASICLRLQKPYTVIKLPGIADYAGGLLIENLIRRAHPKILNVAGTRGSRLPDTDKVRRILDRGLNYGVK